MKTHLTAKHAGVEQGAAGGVHDHKHASAGAPDVQVASTLSRGRSHLAKHIQTA